MRSALAIRGFLFAAVLGYPTESWRAPAETVFADFDLLGWARLGILDAASAGFDAGQLEVLLDDSTSSVLQLPAGTSVISLDFEPLQLIRHVGLTPGGPDACAVTLTVVAEDGRRFAAGEVVVADRTEATFQLIDVRCSRLELQVEPVDEDGTTSVADVRVAGEVAIERISLESVPETLPEGGSFPVLVVGRDVFGGHTDLTALAQLRVSPARAISLVAGNIAVTRVSGPIDITPHLGSLEGERRPLLVTSLADAPPAPTVRIGCRQIRLTIEGQPPFEIFRRRPGETNSVPIGRCDGPHFMDDDVTPGSAHQYSVRRIDAFGNPLSPLGPETRARALSRPPIGQLEPGRLPLLVVLYVDSLPGGAAEADAIVTSLEAARAFVYRHSRGRIHLDTTYLRRSGPTPATDGPSMAHIEQDLRRQGIADDRYGLVFAVASDVAGSWGNFLLLGKSAGAFGRSAAVATPDDALGPDAGVAFCFVHELLHVLGQRLADSVGLAAWPTGHFDQDFADGRLGGMATFDVGDGWDGAAALLARAEFWSEIGPPYRRPFEVVDSDGDGLPDDAPELPFDERRFGSDPALPDTDGDGLDDFGELVAGLYGAADPLVADTDGDGAPDGRDPWPLFDFSGQVQHGNQPVRVGTAPPGQAAGDLALDAAWNSDELLLAFETSQPCELFLELDGSGQLGRWESDAAVGPVEAGGSDVWAGATRLAIRAHAAPVGVFVGGRLLEGVPVTSSVQDGRWRVEVRLPRALGPGATDVRVPADAPRVEGLRLEAGRVLGLHLVARPVLAADPQPFEPFVPDPGWTCLGETHRFLDAVLEPPASEG